LHAVGISRKELTPSAILLAISLCISNFIPACKEKAVNLNLGAFPVFHTNRKGQILELAWKGIADPSSMIEAIKLAAKLKA
jgi:hypothetical protein